MQHDLPRDARPQPPAVGDIMLKHGELLEKAADAEPVEVTDEATRLIDEAVAAGARAEHPRYRRQLRTVISHWIGYFNDTRDEFFPTPALAAYEAGAPLLHDADAGRVLSLARQLQPIVGLRLTGKSIDLRELSAPDEELVKVLDCAFEGCTFDGAELGRARLVHTTFSQCTFVGTNLEEALATSSIFIDCRFDDVRANGAAFAGSRFAATTMVGGHFEGASFTSSEMREVDATGADFREALIDNASIADDVAFDDACFRRTLFIGGDVAARFRGAELPLAIFASVSLDAADFRGARFTEEPASGDSEAATRTAFTNARDVLTARFDPTAPDEADFRKADADAIREAGNGDG